MRSLGSELSPLALGLEFFLAKRPHSMKGMTSRRQMGSSPGKRTIAQSELNIGNIRDVFYAVQVIHFLCVWGLKRKDSKLSRFRFALNVLIMPPCLWSDVLVKKAEKECHMSLRKGAVCLWANTNWIQQSREKGRHLILRNSDKTKESLCQGSNSITALCAL